MSRTGAQIFTVRRYLRHGTIRTPSRRSTSWCPCGPTEHPRPRRRTSSSGSPRPIPGGAVRLSGGKLRFQLLESARPSFFMGPAGLLVMQTRMSKRHLGASGNLLERDLDARLFRVLLAAFPAPTHHHPFGPYDIEVFAAAFMLGAVEQAEAHTIAAALARIGLRDQHRPGIRTPPTRDAFRGRDRIEHGRRSRLDAAHQGKAAHSSLPRSSSSWPSA